MGYRDSTIVRSIREYDRPCYLVNMTTGAVKQRDRVQRRPRSDGERTRAAILRAAASLATVDGLEGLSIGNLAVAIGMSKSGLYAAFGSKQELQLATVEAADRIFREVVVQPALLAPPGLARLVAVSMRTSIACSAAPCPVAASSLPQHWRWHPPWAGQGTGRRLGGRVRGARPGVRGRRS